MRFAGRAPRRRGGRSLLLSAMVGALALTAMAGSVTPAAAQDLNVITLVNSASFGPAPMALARGSFITIFTQRPVTNEGSSINPFPWSTKLAGVSVTTDRCNGIETTALPILFVGPSGTGTQINLYYPNDIGNEPLGTCRTTDTFDLISVAPKPGFEANASGFVNRTVLSQPGVFMDFRAPASDGGVPAGFHLNAQTGKQTSFLDCNADPTRCPVSTAGRQNFLIAFTTGGEIFACPTASQPCNAARRLTFSLTAPGGQPVEQPLSFYGPAGFLGQEQANIQIHPQTTAGEYRLSVGFSFQNSTFRNNQRLLVRLGPATTG
jgi:uncharacterized protein (TIGR03437 family)